MSAGDVVDFAIDPIFNDAANKDDTHFTAKPFLLKVSIMEVLIIGLVY